MALKVAADMEGSTETLTPFPLSEELGFLPPWKALAARLSRELCTLYSAWPWAVRSSAGRESWRYSFQPGTVLATVLVTFLLL